MWFLPPRSVSTTRETVADTHRSIKRYFMVILSSVACSWIWYHHLLSSDDHKPAKIGLQNYINEEETSTSRKKEDWIYGEPSSETDNSVLGWKSVCHAIAGLIHLYWIISGHAQWAGFQIHGFMFTSPSLGNISGQTDIPNLLRSSVHTCDGGYATLTNPPSQVCSVAQELRRY